VQGTECCASAGVIDSPALRPCEEASSTASLDIMLEFLDDNRQLTASVREVHGLCDEHGGIATASLLEIWIDEAERRTWFLV